MIKIYNINQRFSWFID